MTTELLLQSNESFMAKTVLCDEIAVDTYFFGTILELQSKPDKNIKDLWRLICTDSSHEVGLAKSCILEHVYSGKHRSIPGNTVIFNYSPIKKLTLIYE